MSRLITGGLTHPVLLPWCDGPVPVDMPAPRDRLAEGPMILTSSESWLEEVGVAVTMLLSEVEEDESEEHVDVLMTAMSSSSSVSVRSITSGSGFFGESNAEKWIVIPLFTFIKL